MANLVCFDEKCILFYNSWMGRGGVVDGPINVIQVDGQ